jgi:hypothetical protein
MMGITIFASGTINTLEAIPQLVVEVKEIAEKHGWRYSVVDDDFKVESAAKLVPATADQPAVIEGSLGLKGIVLFIDPKCESLGILFNRSGALTCVMQQMLRSDLPGLEPFTSCKTQFGCIDSHIEMVHLLDILKKRYIADLVVTDEGEYWESRDVERLSNKRDVLDHYMDHVSSVIRGIRVSKEDALDADSLGARVEQALLEAEEGKVFH